MIFVLLFLEYFKIGLFSFGGGYATLPFLYHISDKYNWFDMQQLTDMIAVSSITPGPVGVNMATFSGFTTSGILGAVVATSAVVLPSLIIVVSVSKLLKNFSQNKFVKYALYSLKPIGCGLLAAVALNMCLENISSIGTLLIFAGLIIMSLWYKKDALTYLLIAAFAGFAAGIANFL